MPETDQIDKAAGKTSGLLTEIGRGGVRHWDGYIYDDEDSKLQGLHAVREYRRMTKDPTVAAMLFAITSLLRSVTWRMEASDDTPAHQEARDFAEGVLFQDMDHTFEDFIADAATMLPYGFAPFELVYRKRTGTAKGSDPVTGSLYSDGKIGLKKIALRSQDTVARWWFDGVTDDLLGLYQLDPMRGREIEIPMERLVLIRTTPNRGNPEGKSILEAAIRPYRALRVLEHAEASVAVRASGIVTMEIPVDDYNDPTKRSAWESHAREMAEDRAGYMLLPSIFDTKGKKLEAYKVGYTVADGRRSGDYSPIIARKKQEMAAVVLADFIFLGHNNKGALALSTDKTDLFHEAVTGWLNGIAAQVNRVILPRIWALNGMNRDLMPVATPADLSKENLQVLGAFITAMTSAGMVMDDTLEDALRTKANLPLKPKDAEQAGAAPTRPVTPPKKPTDDGLVDAAPDKTQGGRKPAAEPDIAIGKAGTVDDVTFLKALAGDDPAYREALSVLAGGPIPDAVDLDVGGAPATGPVPFPLEVVKHNRYHDARGRFTYGPDTGSGRSGNHPRMISPSKLRHLAGQAADQHGAVATQSLGPVDNAKRILRETGVDLGGYERVIEGSEIRHALKRHGNAKKETAVGQIAITADDFYHVPQITSHPDNVDLVGKTPRGQTVLRYTKTIGKEMIFVSEEIRPGKKHAAFLTMWKRPATQRGTP